MEQLHARDPRIKAIRLSRNFGHQLAITAGLEQARGRAIIIMDADLQDPPEIALELAEKWREGYDVVYAVREARDGESRIKRQTAKWFYRLMGRLGEVDIPADAGDFRLVDRRALDSVLSMPEHHRYLRGLFAWVGYDQTGVTYHRAARHAGKTKFPLRKMLGFAADGIVSFSMAPLRIALSLGFLVSFASIFLGVLAVVLKLSDVYAAPGWASIVVGVSLLGGIQLVVMGVIGEYVARIHEEVKRRPLFLIRDAVGLDPETAATVADHSYRDRRP
jgi:dolichol-phosphate mannosyltransferase